VYRQKERHDGLLPDTEKEVAIMNTNELWSTWARRFAAPAMLVAVLVTTGCATERPAAVASAQGDGGRTTPRTSPVRDDAIDRATSNCETFGCEP
jgi:hypothetical protein